MSYTLRMNGPNCIQTLSSSGTKTREPPAR